MAGMLRPDVKAMKIAYKILKTPKDLRQDNKKVQPKKRRQNWFIDSYLSQ